jgi:hypothetical protein
VPGPCITGRRQEHRRQGEKRTELCTNHLDDALGSLGE